MLLHLLNDTSQKEEKLNTISSHTKTFTKVKSTDVMKIQRIVSLVAIILLSVMQFQCTTTKIEKNSEVTVLKEIPAVEYSDDDEAAGQHIFNEIRTKDSGRATERFSEIDYFKSYSLQEPKEELNTEEYDIINENTFQSPFANPLSTFSIDVDGASYSNLRRFINNGQKPYKDAIRIEEMINYFTYDYPQPTGEVPFSVTTELSVAPWNEAHQLVHIGLQGKKLDYENLAPSNLVFLIDVSGSMNAANKLSLLKSSLKLLVSQLSEKDKVSIAVYAGAAGIILPPTAANNKEKIMGALDQLEAGGSTAGGEGIELAYKLAEEGLLEEGNNRVILATDGDFNVGKSSASELVRMIEAKKQKGIYLTLCGFGMSNYKDGRMEQISNAGNSNYFYIDNVSEARKVFVSEMIATLFTIAKDYQAIALAAE